MTTSPFVRRAALQERADGKVRCLLCERRCLLVEGGRGWCRTRVNRGGTLYTLTYGAVSSLASNPVEKKPFYHFYPGGCALTVGSWGCNFGCPWCQNWEISRATPPENGRFLSPETFVRETLRQGCQGTSISFNEPTLSFEWALEVFRLARARGLYNTFVTNGYMTPAALDELAKAGLDALNVDVKGHEVAVWKYGRGVDVERVWARCRQARALDLHLELTQLVIPGVNDDEGSLADTARRIVEELGPQTPWHVSAYFPAHRFKAPPTPVATLEKAADLGRRAGLEFVYIGNVPAGRDANTCCPHCDALLAERRGLTARPLLRQGAAMLLPEGEGRRPNGPGRGSWNLKDNEARYVVNLRLAVPLTMLTGFFSGMVGISGGSFLVPLMVIGCGVPMRTAVGTASAILAATALAGFSGNAMHGGFDASLALPGAVAAVVGGLLGGRIALETKPRELRFLSGTITMVAAVVMMANVLSGK